jgi:hypothetical protein
VHAGVNEFFISVHGQEQVHDAITKIPGSYAATMEGIRRLSAYPVNVITNTVLTRTNLEHLAGHFSSLSKEPVSEMHLWNYFPMSESDRLDLTVSLPELAACFPELIRALSAFAKPLVLKGFPECVSPGPPVFSTSDFPLNIIQDDFWLEFGRNGFGVCLYKDVCESTECWGLSSAYRQKYGDEQQLLAPLKYETSGGRP